jgi:TPP-dependent indolepyruvate ferredoxin oxidoreductase alpha subunit
MADLVGVAVGEEAQTSEPEFTLEAVDSGFIQDNLQLDHLSYTATRKVPFVIDYFKINEYYPVNSEITSMAKQLHEILVTDDNNTLVEETKKELDYLIDQMNLSENDAGVYKLGKVLKMVQIRARQRELESKKLSVLANQEKMV